jgi:hypothetical protein
MNITDTNILYNLLDKFREQEQDAARKTKEAPEISLALACATMERAWYRAGLLLRHAIGELEAVATHYEDDEDEDADPIEVDWDTMRQEAQDQSEWRSGLVDELRWSILNKICEGWSADDLDEWLRKTDDFGLVPVPSDLDKETIRQAVDEAQRQRTQGGD